MYVCVCVMGGCFPVRLQQRRLVPAYRVSCRRSTFVSYFLLHDMLEYKPRICMQKKRGKRLGGAGMEYGRLMIQGGCRHFESQPPLFLGARFSLRFRFSHTRFLDVWCRVFFPWKCLYSVGLGSKKCREMEQNLEMEVKSLYLRTNICHGDEVIDDIS